MANDFSNKNLQNVSLKEEDLSYSNFSHSDLRGADLTGANLTGADFSHVKTGITTLNTILLFFAALIISLVSGYFAMQAGRTVNGLISSKDANLRTAGIASIVIIVLFILYSYWKGVGTAIRYLIVPASIIALLVAIILYLTGAATGRGALFLVLACFLVAIMFVVGTISRAVAGVLSNVIFLVVALSGGMFGKSLGGGIGTVIMAIACMQISKKALSGAKGFESLRKIASWITRKFGTSFRNTNLTNASFSGSEIHNADFSNADVSLVNWADSKKINTIVGENKFIAK
jgi:uncharacterized protein YjbI with pentapeptide repeats